MSKLTTGEWVITAFLVIACLVNITGSATGGPAVAFIWAVLAVVFVKWRLNRHEAADAS